jgi:hypothetical protein
MTKRSLGLALAGCLAAGLLTGASAVVSRAAMQTLERAFDRRVQEFSIDDPILLLGNTRGVYLQGYGAVFTAEVNLVPVPISPFHQVRNPEQMARLHSKKLQRLPVLRDMMEKALVDIGAALDNVPPDENVVLAVSLFHFSWEDTKQLPRQVLLEAKRRNLVDYSAGRLDRAGLAARIQSREF